MTPRTPSEAQIEALTEINLDDFCEALGLANLQRGRRVLRWLFRPAARRFARLVADFDQAVGEGGLQSASARLFRQMAGRLEAAGREHIPAEGPALVLANHPGLSDTLALFASLPRADVRVIALARPFLLSLPHTSARMIYVPNGDEGRLSAVRAAVDELRRGRTLLTFPAGEIEPDPAALPGAAESLQQWSQSIGLFARLVPQTRIVPAIVSGVVSPASLRNPLTRLRRARKDRERLAAALQVMIRAYQNVRVRVAFGAPLVGADLLTGGADSAAVTRAVTGRARQLIESPPREWEAVISNQ
jgi:1-acyl-sn-glycerol-3-phosphate acyltransferase